MAISRPNPYGSFDTSTGQYKVDVPTALGKTGAALRAVANTILAQLSDSSLPRDVRDLAGALQALMTALDGLMQSQIDQIALSLDPTLNTETQWQRMGASFKQAANNAEGALSGLEAQLDAAQTALNKLLLPQKPQGASDVALEGAAARLERLLPKSAPELMTVAPKLLQELLDEGDTLAAFVLCGQAGSPLGLFYRAIGWTAGVNMTGYLAALAKAAAQARSTSAPSSQATALLGLVSGGGSGTVRGVIDAARWAINDWRQQLSSYAQSMDPHRYDIPR